MEPSLLRELASTSGHVLFEIDISPGSDDQSGIRAPKNSDYDTNYINTAYTVPGSRGECDDAVPDALPTDGSWTKLTENGGDGSFDKPPH